MDNLIAFALGVFAGAITVMTSLFAMEYYIQWATRRMLKKKISDATVIKHEIVTPMAGKPWDLSKDN